MDTSSPSGGSQDDLPTTVGAEIELIPGQVLADRFVIEAALGQGGQAQVYQAHDQITENTLAIKILGRRSELSEIAIERLRDELLVARKVSDPHVIRVHEFYRGSDYVFYTMDYVAGETLATRLQRPLDCSLAQRWIVQLVSALKACHRAEIVHGDIKPGNLLINTNNDLILADFGISAREYAGYMQETGSGHYRAPESLAGEPVTRAVDVYALGRVIQRLLGVVKTKSWSERLWYWHWQRQVQKLLCEDPKRRLGLPQLRLAPQTPSMGQAVSALAAVLVVVFGWYLLQSASVSTPKTELPIAVDSMPVVHRIAVVHTSSTAQSSQIAAIAALKFAAEPQVVLTSEARVQQLINQLQLKPHEHSRDRQRLASLLNVEVLVFLEPMLHGNEEHDYLQVYLSRHPDNQLFGVTEIEVSQGPLRALEQFIEHVQQQLALTLPTNTPDLQLSASLAQLMVQVQQLDSIEQLIVTEREFVSDFASEPAFWYALAQSAYELGDDTEAQRYVQALQQTQSEQQHSYWLLLGRVLEGELQQDFSAAAAALDRLLAHYPGRPELLERRADLALILDDVDYAEMLLEQSLEIDPNSGYRWFALGRLRINLGDIQSAIHHELAQGLIRFQQQEDLAGQGVVLNAFGVAYLRLGNLELAQQYFSAAVDVRQQAEDLAGQAVSLSNLANVLAILQKYNEADERLHEAMTIFTTLQDFRGRAQVLNERGYLAEEQGLYPQALQYFRQALDLRVRYGSTEEQAETISNVAFVYFLSGDYSQADVFLRQAYTLFERIGLQSGMLRMDLQLAHLHLFRGEYQTATRILARVSEQVGDHRPIEKAFLYFLLSQRNFGLGHFEGAFEHVQVALETARGIGDFRAVVENHLWYLEMCFWLANLDCYAANHSELVNLQNEFTAEQATVWEWLNALVTYLNSGREDLTTLVAVQERATQVHLPIQTELKIQLSLWEFAPEIMTTEMRQSLLLQVRPAYYKDYLHLHYLAVRDGLKDAIELEQAITQHQGHWRNHLFLRATSTGSTQSWSQLDALPTAQAERYRCWFFRECNSEL